MSQPWDVPPPGTESFGEVRGAVVHAGHPNAVTADLFASIVVHGGGSKPDGGGGVVYPYVFRRWRGDSGAVGGRGPAAPARFLRNLRATLSALWWLATVRPPPWPPRTALSSGHFGWHPHRDRVAVATGTGLVLALSYRSPRSADTSSFAAPATAHTQRSAHVTARLSHAFQHHVTCVAWAPLSEATLAVATSNGVCLWHGEAKTPVSLDQEADDEDDQWGKDAHGTHWWMSVLRLPGFEPVSDVSWSPCGRWLAAACPARASVVVWDVPTRTPAVMRIPLWPSPHVALRVGTTLVRWSPCARYLWAGTTGSSFIVWETSTWRCRVWEDLDAPVKSACWGPDGVLLLALTGCPEVVVFQMGDGLEATVTSGVDVATDLVDVLPADVVDGGRDAPSPSSAGGEDEDRGHHDAAARTDDHASDAGDDGGNGGDDGGGDGGHGDDGAGPAAATQPPTMDYDDDFDFAVLPSASGLRPPTADDDDDTVPVINPAASLPSMGATADGTTAGAGAGAGAGACDGDGDGDGAASSPRRRSSSADLRRHSRRRDSQLPRAAPGVDWDMVAVREVVWDPLGSRVCVSFEHPSTTTNDPWCSVIAVYVTVASSLALRGFLRGPPGAGPPHNLCWSPSFHGGALLSALYSKDGTLVVKSWPLLFHNTDEADLLL